MLISGLVCLVLFFAGEIIISWWTNGVVQTDSLFFNTYLLYAFLGSISSVSINVIFATNSFKKTGIAYLLLTSGCIVLNATMIKYFDLSFASITLIGFEIVYILISFRIVFHLLETRWKNFSRSLSFQDLMVNKIERN